MVKCKKNMKTKSSLQNVELDFEIKKEGSKSEHSGYKHKSFITAAPFEI